MTYGRILRFRSATEVKDASIDHVPLQLAKSTLYLIEPRKVRWREVKFNVWMLNQELLHQIGLVRGEVVQDHVDFLPGLLRRMTSPKKATNS